MSYLKNTTTKWELFAYDATTGIPVTGDALNITVGYSNDYGGISITDAINPTERTGGKYVATLTAAESDADTTQIYPSSTTTNVEVIATTGDDTAAEVLAAAVRTNLTSEITEIGSIKTTVEGLPTVAPNNAGITQIITDIATLQNAANSLIGGGNPIIGPPIQSIDVGDSGLTPFDIQLDSSPDGVVTWTAAVAGGINLTGGIQDITLVGGIGSMNLAYDDSIARPYNVRINAVWVEQGISKSASWFTTYRDPETVAETLAAFKGDATFVTLFADTTAAKTFAQSADSNVDQTINLLTDMKATTDQLNPMIESGAFTSGAMVNAGGGSDVYGATFLATYSGDDVTIKIELSKNGEALPGTAIGNDVRLDTVNDVGYGIVKDPVAVTGDALVSTFTAAGANMKVSEWVRWQIEGTIDGAVRKIHGIYGSTESGGDLQTLGSGILRVSIDGASPENQILDVFQGEQKTIKFIITTSGAFDNSVPVSVGMKISDSVGLLLILGPDRVSVVGGDYNVQVVSVTLTAAETNAFVADFLSVYVLLDSQIGRLGNNLRIQQSI